MLIYSAELFITKPSPYSKILFKNKIPLKEKYNEEITTPAFKPFLLE